MTAFAAPASSAFRGVQVPASPLREGSRCARSRTPTVAAVLPREERRAAEIQRLAAQLAELRAIKAAAIARREKERVAAERQAFVPVERAPSRAYGEEDALQRLKKHGHRSRFCGISKISGSEYFPRILAVAGKLPGLSPEALHMAPGGGDRGFSRVAPAGRIGWSNLPPGFSGEIVAVPLGSEVLGQAEDLIAIRLDIEHVAPNLHGDGNDAVAVIDRSNRAQVFDNLKFYAWDIRGEVHLGWFESKPAESEARCLGRIMFILVEEDRERARAQSCWKEEEEVW